MSALALIVLVSMTADVINDKVRFNWLIFDWLVRLALNCWNLMIIREIMNYDSPLCHYL